MTKAWALTKLSEVLQPISRPERVDPTKEYRLLGIRLDGVGPFHRETIQGSHSAATFLYKVKTGDFIYSRLFACRGAFGIIGSDLDGCYVSGEFPTFVTIDDRVDVNFLKLWFRLPMTIRNVDSNCTGSTPLTRNRFKANFFLNLDIPLPPVTEQRRVVAKIDELAAKIEEARTLRQQTVEEGERLLISMAHRHDLNSETKEREDWKWVSLSEVLLSVDDSHRVEAERTYPNFGIYSFGRGLFKKQPIDGALTSATTLRRVRKGQFVYSRLFAFEGAYWMVTDGYDGFFVSNEYPTFDCVPSRIRVEFLWAHFKSSAVWKEVAVGSKGLGDRRQRVQPTQLLSYRLWLPPLEWQTRIAEVQAQVDALKRLQTETTAKRHALLPSILDKAFKGEL